MNFRRRLMALFLMMYLLIFSLMSTYAQDDNSIDDLVVVNTTELDMIAGPSNTAAYLAPDGSKFAHYSDNTICVYSLPDVEEMRCIDMPEDSRALADSVQWSPEGRYLVMESHDFLRMLLDTDLLLVDTVEGTVTNVTDDGIDGSIMGADAEGTALIDLSPQWVVDDGFIFIRYEVTEGEFSQASLYAYLVGEDEAVPFAPIDQSEDRLDVYMLAVQSETEQYAFYLDQRGDDVFEIYLTQNNDEGTVSIAGATEPNSRYAGIGLLSFSSDGQYLMNYDIRMLGMGPNQQWSDAENSIAQLIDLDSGESMLIDENHFVTEAGWSPEGNGLVYVNYDIELGGGGLFITSSAGEPGRMILSFEEMDIQSVGGTTPMRQQTIMWASNNTILVSQFPGANLLLIELGTE